MINSLLQGRDNKSFFPQLPPLASETLLYSWRIPYIMSNWWEVELAICNRIWKCQWFASPESFVVKTMAMVYTLIVRCTEEGSVRSRKTQRIFSSCGDNCSKTVSPRCPLPGLSVGPAAMEKCWYPHQASSKLCLGCCFCLVSIGSSPCALLFLWICGLFNNSLLFNQPRPVFVQLRTLPGTKYEKAFGHRAL